jgi:N-carbamoylputrescine amidase
MKDITLAIVVSNCPVGNVRQNLDRMIPWVVKARQKNAKIVCFPELNLTGYSTRPDIRKSALTLHNGTIRDLEDLAIHQNILLLAGMIEIGSDGKFYAGHVVVGPDGFLGMYRKLHLAPPEKDIFSPGADIPLFQTPECRFGIQLCYDAHFPELSTRMALDGADVIFMPHASPRGTPENKCDSWMRHLPARAYDNSVYVVAWNQIGDNGSGLDFPGLAMVIGPSGKVEKQALVQREALITVTLSGNALTEVRKNRMHFFLPNRRSDLFPHGAH